MDDPLVSDENAAPKCKVRVPKQREPLDEEDIRFMLGSKKQETRLSTQQFLKELPKS